MLSTFGYRTKPLTESRAISFQKCIATNKRFTNAVVSQVGKLWAVFYEPVNEKIRQSFLQRAEAIRKENATKEKYNYKITWMGYAYRVENKRTGQVYETSEYGCSCPDYQHRLKDKRARCKHMSLCIK